MHESGRRYVRCAGAIALLTLVACGSGEPSGAVARAKTYAFGNGTDVLLIEQNGHTTLSATRPPWRIESPHRLASGTKSFAGVVAIAAVEDGYLTLDEPAADTLTEWRSDPRKSRITIRELLNQSDGLDPQAGLPADDAYRAALDAPAIHEPGTTFDYGPNHFSAFAALLGRKLRSHGVRGDALDYLRSRVLDRIGVRVADWDRDGVGQPLFAGRSYLSAAEWIKFGRLIARRGAWEHRRILEPALVDEMLTPSAANRQYGLGWWLDPGADEEGSGRIPGVPRDLVMAAGAGNQRLYVLPSCGLVVVRFGEEEGFEDRGFLTRLFARSSGELPTRRGPCRGA